MALSWILKYASIKINKVCDLSVVLINESRMQRHTLSSTLKPGQQITIYHFIYNLLAANMFFGYFSITGYHTHYIFVLNVFMTSSVYLKKCATQLIKIALWLTFTTSVIGKKKHKSFFRTVKENTTEEDT